MLYCDAMLKKVLEQGREAADIALEELLPPASQYPTSIHQAMRHSVFAGGKRLRPILCMESGRMITLAAKSHTKSSAGSPPPGIEQVGAALEMLHTLSLIHILTGESGIFLSPYYLDQWKAWYEGSTFAFPFSQSAVEHHRAHEMTLEPK